MSKPSAKGSNLVLHNPSSQRIPGRTMSQKSAIRARQAESGLASICKLSLEWASWGGAIAGCRAPNGPEARDSLGKAARRSA